LISLTAYPVINGGDEGQFYAVCNSKGQLFGFLGQLPWRDNMRNVSAIPPGTYRIRLHKCEKHGQSFLIENVPGRSNVEIHIGNWVGAKDKGLKSDSLGCPLLGRSVGILEGQLAVLQSSVAFKEWVDRFGPTGAFLTISETKEDTLCARARFS